MLLFFLIFIFYFHIFTSFMHFRLRFLSSFHIHFDEKKNIILLFAYQVYTQSTNSIYLYVYLFYTRNTPGSSVYSVVVINILVRTVCTAITSTRSIHCSYLLYIELVIISIAKMICELFAERNFYRTLNVCVCVSLLRSFSSSCCSDLYTKDMFSYDYFKLNLQNLHPVLLFICWPFSPSHSMNLQFYFIHMALFIYLLIFALSIHMYLTAIFCISF